MPIPTSPTTRPRNPCYSSGPCAKRPGWTPAVLEGALVGRSHRSKECKARLAEVIDRTRSLLGIPADYKIAIVPASDTGAIEMAMWNLLGPRPVDVFAWESFGQIWLTDVVKQLKLKDARTFTAEYGKLPDLKQANPAHDIVFTWNGTTSGVRVPDGNWISGAREGLTFCDATSAVFAMALPWDKLDVTTWSWQKVLGGEAQHGMLVLSPRAVARLESHTPSWPLPKIFRMTKGGKLEEAIFKGDVINTPSMLCVEDALDGLRWAEKTGGLPKLIERSANNLKAVADWVGQTPWAGFLATDPATRSSTSICIRLADPRIAALGPEQQEALVKQIAALLDKERVAHDIAGHRDAPPHLRIWGGATIETADIKALLPWLDWAYANATADLKLAA